MRKLSRRGDATTNVILFIVLILAALIIVSWYAGVVRPTRLIIGTVTHDMAQLRQHFANACAVTIYNASYFAESSMAQIRINNSEYCILTDTFSSCDDAPCALMNAEVSLESKRSLVRIERDAGGPVLVR